MTRDCPKKGSVWKFDIFSISSWDCQTTNTLRFVRVLFEPLRSWAHGDGERRGTHFFGVFLVCQRSGHTMRWWHRQRPWFHSPFLGWKWGCCMNWIEELGVVRFGIWLGIHHHLTMLSLRELFHVEFKMGDSGGTVSVVLDRFPFVEVATRHVWKTHCTVIPWGAGRYNQGLPVWGGFGSELDSQS